MDFDSIIDWVIRVFPEFLSKWSDSLIIFLVTLWTKSILFVGKCLSSLVAFAEQLWQKTLLLFSDIGTGFTEFTREIRAKFPEVFPDYILSIVYPLPDWALFIVIPTLLIIFLIILLKKAADINSQKAQGDENIKSENVGRSEPVISLGEGSTERSESNDQSVIYDNFGNDIKKLSLSERNLSSSDNKIIGTDLEKRIRQHLGAEKIFSEKIVADKKVSIEWIEETLVNPQVQKDVISTFKTLSKTGHETENFNIIAENPSKRTSSRLNNIISGAGVPATPGPILAKIIELEEKLKTKERFAAKNPSSFQGHREVALGLSQLGDALTENGDFSGAISFFEQSLTVFERLAQSHPSSAEALRDVVVSLNRLGDALVTKEIFKGANEKFILGLQISQHLAEQIPQNRQAQRDIWFSLNKLGDVSVKTGNTNDAIAYFEAGFQISKNLADLYPENTETQRDLIVSCSRLGDTCPAQGWWSRALTICEKLSKAGMLPTSDYWMLEDLYRRSAADKDP
ncbi:MAG: tetratricopeptide repeat protein [Pseudomonadota bacterium]|nr:tetratricopeptide repeat protein [Pseudomonadota bacterium]